jgi:predicted transcriptional regulator
MTNIDSLEEGLEIFKALSSEVRLKVIRLLVSNKQLNMNDLAKRLKITNGALTSHIKVLCDCGIIEVNLAAGKRGSQKICRLKEDKILINLVGKTKAEKLYQTELNVGQYTSYKVNPICGIATTDSIIGEVDDPRYFDDPERTNAGIIWFSKGFVEYRIPNYLKCGQFPTEIQISMEISSEAPGYNDDWPSDIYFSINGKELGYWISPGDYGDTHGVYTPSWWPKFNQYGLMKLLTIKHDGTFMDGKKISDVKIDDLALNSKSGITLCIAAPENAENPGGVTLFGQGFGNYNQGIVVRVKYESNAQVVVQ